MVSLVAVLTLLGSFGNPASTGDLDQLRAALAAEKDPSKRVTLVQAAIASQSGSDGKALGPFYILLGDAFCDARNTKEANLAYRKAEPFVTALEPRSKVDTLNNIAKKLYQSSDAHAASSYLRSAVYTARQARFLKDALYLGTNLGNISVWDAERDLCHARGAVDAAEVGERFLIGENLADLAYRGFEGRQYERAIHYFEAALGVGEWNEASMREATLQFIVTSAGYAGDWRRAQKYGPQVYENFRRRGDPDEAAMVLNNMAFADMNADRYSQAIVGFRRAISETLPANRDQLATIHFNLGMTYSSLENWHEALKAFQESRSQAKGFDEGRVHQCDVSIGMVLLKQGKPRSALPYLKRGISLGVEGGGGLTDTIVAYELLEQCYGALGDKVNADKTGRALEDILANELGNLEVLRLGLGGLISELNTYAATAQIYATLVGRSLKRGDLSEAFYRAEMSKARTLVDLEHRKPIDLSKLSLFERDSLAWLRNRLNQMQGPDSGTRPEQAQMSLRLAYEELAAYEAFLRADPAEALARGEDRVKQSNREEDIARMPEDTVILEFVQSVSLNQNQVGAILAWSDKGRARFASHVLMDGKKPIEIDALSALSADFLQACRSSSSGGPDRGSVTSVGSGRSDVGSRLQKIIAEPLKARLGKFKNIVIIPDASVQAIPFEAIPIGSGKLMIDAWEISYAFSATQYLQARQEAAPPAKNQMLLVANPLYGEAPEDVVLPSGSRGNNLSELAPLPGTQVEAERIKAVLPGALMLQQSNATAGVVRGAMADYGILHFATHGLFDPVNAMASSLAFAKPPNGTRATELTAHEVQGMKLSARLAVLSACDTARGEFRFGEGPVGLTFAFLKAGVPAVVSSRWRVDDAKTADLMADFYRNLSGGERVGRSLRLAMLAAKAKDPQAYFWAPFALFGDGRK